MPEIISIIQNIQSEASATSAVGSKGERLAADFLIKAGYRLVLSNFKVPVGRNTRGAVVTGEVVLIGYDGDRLCFIEVKTRSSDAFAAPLAAVDLRKQRQIIRAARMYRKIFHLPHASLRYDVVSIVLPESGRPKIDLFKGFYSEAKFRKNFWADEY
jgi:putative endonuclease